MEDSTKLLNQEWRWGSSSLIFTEMDNGIQCLQGTSQHTEGVGNSPKLTSSLLVAENTRGHRKQAR